MSVPGRTTPTWVQLPSAAPQQDAELFQFSIMDSLLEGLYEGEMTFGALAAHGDFGIGTFNDLDGEMIAFDGRFHQLRSNGSAALVKPEQKTPFASVTFFRPHFELRFATPVSQKDVERRIQETSSTNLFTAVQVQGTFSIVQTRTVGRQVRPFPPLTEAAAHEEIREFRSVDGTLAGFYTPSFAQGIGVAGFHLHFLTSDVDGGGHVISYLLEKGMIRLMTLRRLHLELPADESFLHAPLDDSSAAQKIQAAEGGHIPE